MHLDQNVSLKPYHTFGMEVKSRYFVEAKSRQEILTLLNYRHMIRMPILFLGGGSNLLFTRNFSGIVIRINSKGITLYEEDEQHVYVSAEAGEEWDGLVRHCVSKGWAGLENLSLIPGTVGAAPIQNIGAYGAEVKDVIESVLVVDVESGKERRFSAGECRFGYRDSLFKQELKGKVIILSVNFKLSKTSGNHPEAGGYRLKLEYGNIREELSAMGVDNPGIAGVREAVCNIRRRKLPDPALLGNAGSFFKNPVIGNGMLRDLIAGFPQMPYYPDGTDRAKVPAAWLIDQCGWKGFREGDAGVHALQPLVLVNYGNATGDQVAALAYKIIGSVKEKFGIALEPEVNIIG